jgi:hypothetical protein
MNVYHDDYHGPIQSVDKVVSARQPWWFIIPSYNLLRTGASTPITTSTGFKNQPPHTNINLVPTNSEMERLHLLNKLEQLRHINQRPSNQSISIPHLKHVEPKATPTVVWGITYPQSTWPTRLVLGEGERLQVPHHRSVLRGNQGVGTITCSYCHQIGRLLNHCPLINDGLR